MQGYRLYFLTPDGRISRAAEIECSDDVEATLHAEDQRGDHAIEVWTGKRMVAMIPKRQDA
jgi:hypothetical protein